MTDTGKTIIDQLGAPLGRRRFLSLAGAGATALAVGGGLAESALAAPFKPEVTAPSSVSSR